MSRARPAGQRTQTLSARPRTSTRHPQPPARHLRRRRQERQTRSLALTGQIEQTQAEIDAMAVHLGELHEAIEHLRITRKTLL
ncbi:hypothetical protein ACGFNP_19960 [Nonomuraea sp. NPDC049269]|uniref:hypothetical protein n=1 Tax=Nonomuraea sp. NPDC049269 TaxID=3364349 RepID=UPI00371FCC08